MPRAALLSALFLTTLAAPASAERLRLTLSVDAPATNVHLVPPLDAGGGADRLGGRERRVLAYLLAIFIGFGTGHLLLGDDDGFLFFLIVDAVIVAAPLGLFFLWPIRYVSGLLLFASHIWQLVELIDKKGGGGDLPLWSPPRMRPLERGSPSWANGLMAFF